MEVQNFCTFGKSNVIKRFIHNIRMKSIAGIAFDIPSDNDDYIRIDSNDSLSDYDIAIFCPDLSNTYYYHDSDGYEGKSLYDKSSSPKIIAHTEHWKKELLSYLQSGKTLFVVLKKREDFFIHSGSKGFSGTGRNQKTINYVQPHSNYDYLPFQSEIINASGKILYPVNPLISLFYNEFKNYISYEVYLNSSDKSEKLFTTKNKDKILGAYSKYNNGFLVFFAVY